MSKEKNMEFSVQDFKGVENVKITATQGDLVIVAGKNGAGKSSFIDAITELFDSRGVRLTPKPIRDGEKKAAAEFTDEALDIRVRRTWTKDDAGKLEVYATDGAKYGKPSDVLAKLTGGLIFDPGRFLTLDEKKQRDELLAKVQLPFDLAELDREKSGAEERRREAGREVKRLTGALSALPDLPDDYQPGEEVSASVILDEIRTAEEEHRLAADTDRSVAALRERRAEIEAQIRRLTDELAQTATQISDAEFAIATRPQLADLDALREKLESVEQTNAAIREARQWRATRDELDTAEAAQAAENAKLKEIEQRKLDGLAQADWPDPDLGIDDDGVTLDGIPFRQVNTARKILAAARIATSGDPELKLVIVSNGDLLDGDSLAMVRDLAAERGFTVLMERDRDDSREIGFEIVEGNLVA